jgi:dCMP deaminase
MTEIPDKLKYAYLKIAHVFAQCSSAQRLKVGAVLVRDQNIISFSYNGTPSGWYSNQCEDTSGVTLAEVIHAESNLLTKLAKQGGVGSLGSVMFITHSPCFNCAKLILQAGVSKVYYSVEYRLTDGIEFLRKSGIQCEKLVLEPESACTVNE